MTTSMSVRSGGQSGASRSTSGSGPRVARRWDYVEMRLPLELGTMRGWLGEEHLIRRMARRADSVIEQHVEGLTREGWQPDESTSFLSLYRRNRVQAKYRGGVVPGHTVSEVSIRFKRPRD